MSRRDERIRICYVLNRYVVGGAETVAWDTARNLDPERYDAYTLAPLEPAGEISEMRRRYLDCGMRADAMHGRSFRDPRLLWAMWRYFRRHRFDIVHGHNRSSDAWAVRVGGWAKVPLLYWTRHSVYADFTPAQTARYRRLAPRTRQVLAVSDAVRRNCIEVEGLDPGHVVTVPNGIDTGRFAPLAPDARAVARAALGLSDDERLLLFVGRVNHLKNPDAFTRLIWRLRERGRPVRGFLCGHGPMSDDIDALVEGGPGGVAALGLRNDVPRLLAAADLFVSTSRVEGMPLNVMEAMSCTAPLVGPDIPQIRQLLEGTELLEACLYPAPPLEGDVPAELVETWADKIEDVLDHPDRAAAHGRLGREIIESSFSVQRMVDRHCEIYERDLAAIGKGRA